MQTPKNTSFIISYLALRIGLGFVGISLPIVLIIGSFLFSNCGTLQASISHYYYTVMGNYFVGALSAVAMFLFFYKGYDKQDAAVANLAGFCALGVAFFPTGVDYASTCNYITSQMPSVNTIHYLSAGLLFSCFAYFSLVLFTKTHQPHNITPHKKIRNNIYKICGLVIVACILLLAIYHFVGNLQLKLAMYKPTLVLESIALFAFGISWVTKGEMYLKDN